MITYHHIGGRNGTYPLPLKKGKILGDFHLILYDADSGCIKQMHLSEQGDWGKVSILPYCISGKTGRAPFYLNFHPTTNSLYPFNVAYQDYNYVNNPLYGEYRFGDACQKVNTITLDLYSLNDALKKSRVSHVDFLSLDVQGAEHDILSGAVDLIQTSCIGIQLEVEFVQLYQDQKTFFDIHPLMQSLNFELIELDTFGRCAPISLPIGFRGLEQPLHAEAVYIKSLQSLIEKKDIDSLYKAAFFALIYKKVGLCLRYLNAIDALKIKRHVEVSVPLYQQCLEEIWSLYIAAQDLRFPRLSQLFSNEKFKHYYSMSEEKLAETVDESVSAQLQSLVNALGALPHENDSALERVFIKYQLYDVADAVRNYRTYEVDCVNQLSKKLSLCASE